MVGQNTFADEVRGLLEKSGIRNESVYFEEDAAKAHIMKYIEDDPEAMFGVFISAENSRRSTVSLYYNSQRERDSRGKINASMLSFK